MDLGEWRAAIARDPLAELRVGFGDSLVWLCFVQG